MKIYISDKENIDLFKNCFLTFSTKDKETVDWNVLAQSLEQHDAETRKPLEDEIEYLKYQIKDIEKDLEASHSAYKDLKQKVIAELEEWVVYNKNEHSLVPKYYVQCDTLEQKLNEMKEV